MVDEEPKNENQNTTSEPVVTKKKKKRRVRGRRGEGLRIKGSKEKFKRSYPGEDAKIEIHPEEKEDPEKLVKAPRDQASKHKFPPPKKNLIFRKIWMLHIDNLSARDNFKIGHLEMLSMLCDLHVQYDELETFIRKKGRSYESIGRNGRVFKFYPEVSQLTRVVAQIKDYTKILNLLPGKDNSPESGGEGDEWD